MTYLRALLTLLGVVFIVAGCVAPHVVASLALPVALCVTGIAVTAAAAVL